VKSVLHCILSQASASVEAVMILSSSFLLCHGALLFLILSVLRARQISSYVCAAITVVWAFVQLFFAKTLLNQETTRAIGEVGRTSGYFYAEADTV
jgi:membrane protein YdbS with pleckstrin-like domain